MTRTALSLLVLALGLLPLAGCPTADDDDSSDDDDATGDDDDATGDDDDATGSNDVSDTEPNDVYPFQDIGVLDVGRTSITGTLTTAGDDGGVNPFFAGDVDLFTFQLVNAASVSFSLGWDTAGDDLDVLLFGSLTDTSVLAWDSAQLLNEAASTDRPEEFSMALSGNVEYTVMVGNFEGDPNAAYTLTVDVP
jgi:hypothetical protein